MDDNSTIATLALALVLLVGFGIYRGTAYQTHLQDLQAGVQTACLSTGHTVEECKSLVK